MAHRDRTAVDVDLVERDIEIARGAQHHGGEGFVDLVEIDVAGLHTALGECLLRRRADAGEHDGRLRADDLAGGDLRAGLEAQFRAGFLAADQHEGRAVDDAGAVAGVVDVMDLLDRRVLAQRRGIEAHLAHLLEARFQARQRLRRGAGPDGLVVVEHGDAVDVLHRDHALLEVTCGLGGGSALVRARGEGVNIMAGEAFEAGDQVRADALWRKAHQAVDARVHHHRAAIAAHRPAAHALDAAGDHEVFLAAHHLHCSEVHALQARGAEAALRHAGHGLVPAGVEHGGARDIRALLADRGHATQNDVVHQRGVEMVAGLERVEERLEQVHRRDLVQRTVLLALAARRAHGVVDVSLGHCSSR